MSKTLAAHMLDIMKDEGIDYVHLGEKKLLEKCSVKCGSPKLNSLPDKKKYHRIMNALEKSGLFKKITIQRPDKPAVTARCFIAA
jgi:hypothetical protein